LLIIIPVVHLVTVFGLMPEAYQDESCGVALARVNQAQAYLWDVSVGSLFSAVEERTYINHCGSVAFFIL
jgi:hypothetical protein